MNIGTPRCAGMHVCSHLSMHVQPNLAPPDTPRTSWGWGGVSVLEGAWPAGSCSPNTIYLRGHGRALAMAPPRCGGLRGAGVGSPSCSDGGPCLESRRLLLVPSSTVSTATLKSYSCCLANHPALVRDTEPRLPARHPSLGP